MLNATATTTDRIFITGGTGFVGGTIRQALAGRPLRLLVRDPAQDAALAGADVELVPGDVTDLASLRGIMDGCAAVIHLVAIIAEQGQTTFDRVIRQGTEHVVAEATRTGVGRFLHMSALGATDDPRFPYLQAKWRAEQAVRGSDIPWTIFRPSVIFGPGDGFINPLAGVVRRFPVIPVVGSGQSKFQPVAVSEVAAAFVHALDDPATIGQIEELGGGQIYTYEGMLDVIAARLHKRKPKVHLPVGLMKLVVALSAPLPKALRPPVSSEQLKMLALDNCTDQSATERLIGHPPTKLEDGIGYVVDR